MNKSTVQLEAECDQLLWPSAAKSALGMLHIDCGPRNLIETPAPGRLGEEDGGRAKGGHGVRANAALPCEWKRLVIPTTNPYSQNHRLTSHRRSSLYSTRQPFTPRTRATHPCLALGYCFPADYLVVPCTLPRFPRNIRGRAPTRLATRQVAEETCTAQGMAKERDLGRRTDSERLMLFCMAPPQDKVQERRRSGGGSVVFLRR